MSDLPSFTDAGLLPPGEYALTLAELRDSMLVLGPGAPRGHPTWDAAWRARLVESLAVVVGFLREAAIHEVFINGSFVEDKDHPNDIDGYFICDHRRFARGDIESALNRLDPRGCWTWDPAARRPYRGYPKRQLPMWHAHRIELYPHCPGAFAGRDERGHPLEFPACFRTCRRTGQSKGIVRIVAE